MSEWNCGECKKDFETGKDDTFGGECKCPHCGTEFEIEWDYVGEDCDSTASWLVKK